MIHQRSNPYNVKVIDTAGLLRDQTALTMMLYPEFSNNTS